MTKPQPRQHTEEPNRGPDEEGKLGGPVRELEILIPENAQVIYSNQAQVTVTPWDFTYNFGRVTEVSEDKASAVQLVSIIHSPPHAKAFLQLLQRQIERYEKEFAPIPDLKRT